MSVNSPGKPQAESMSVEQLATYTDFSPADSNAVSFYDQRRSNAQLAGSIDTIGHLNCLQTEVVTDTAGEPRIRHNATMSIDDRQYALRVTEASPEHRSRDNTLVAMLPGMTEDPSFGTAMTFHDNVAAQYPGRTIASISSDGINKHGSPVTWRDLPRSGFGSMAQARLKLIGELSGDDRASIIGLSMGTVITHKMLQFHTQQPTFDLESVVYHSPAIVPPNRVKKDMVMRFLPHIYSDTAWQAVRHPRLALQAARLPDGGTLPALTSEIVNLLQGTNEEEVHQILDAGVPLGVVLPQRDPLAQIDMWQRLQQQHPDNLRLLMKPNRGHGTGLDTHEAAVDARMLADKLGQIATSWL